MFYCFMDSPIGKLFLAGDQDGLKHINFPKEKKPVQSRAGLDGNAGFFYFGRIRTQRILCRKTAAIFNRYQTGRDTFSVKRLEGIAAGALWGNCQLWGTGATGRKPQGLPSGRGSQWRQSDPNHYPLPPRDRRQWRFNRVWRGIGDETISARAGKRHLIYVFKKLS